MQWTEEQLRVLEKRGGNLLLSAAAGSGKTTVLVERVLRLILEDGADVDRMLIVTFTRAAANDMRAKLSKKLSERAAKGDSRCRDQEIRLERASITTLHAFCSDFLHSNFEIAGVDPDFRILDDAEQRQLKDAALDEVLEEAYARPDDELSALDYGRGPANVRALVDALCEVLEERPDPDEWLEAAAGCDASLIEKWCAELVNGAKRGIEMAKVQAIQAYRTPECPDSYISAIEKDLEALEQLEAIQEYDPLFRALDEFKAARAVARRGSTVNEEAKEAVKALREGMKKALNVGLREHPLAQSIRDIRALAPQLHKLGLLAKRASQRFDEKKAEQSGLTYADLERRTLQALTDDSVAQSVREKFDYVFIDEYQDTSDIQEAIVSRVCRDDNRFMVGDVKQSIYRFRLAEPRLFLNKYSEYGSGKGGTLLPLTCNFRSKPAILRFVNLIFERVMTGGDSEIVYDELARLNPGQSGEVGADVEIHILQERSDEDIDSAIAELKTQQRQGMFIAKTIRAMMAADPSLRFRDFAILTRTKSSTFKTMLPMLLAEGIPAYADGAQGYFDAMEIGLALSMLQLVANRRSDVALIGVLHSPVAGLTAQELAEIRAAYGEMPFFDAAWRFAYGVAPDETPDALPDGDLAARLRDFFDMLTRWRLRAGSENLGVLLSAMLEESGFYVYAGALPGGAQRQANLDLLVSDAGAFDDGVSGSVVRFLKHTERLKLRGDTDLAHLLGENDDVVRMMTVHKSKGLEFKVVFGAMLERSYARAQAQQLYAHRDLKIGIPLFDPALQTKRKTIAQTAIVERAQREDAAEEMRILYVLLTRAQERLILIGSVKDADKAQRRWNAVSRAISAASSHLDLIMAARTAAEREGAALYSKVFVHSPSELTDEDQTIIDPRVHFDEIARNPMNFKDAALEKEMNWRYPDARSSKKPLKLTVSGLLRELEGPEVLPELAQRPAFLAEESASRMTATERGTAYHRAMQLINLTALEGLDGRPLIDAVRGQLLSFKERRLMSDAQCDAVRPTVLALFLSGEMGRRLRAAAEVRREWSFNVMVKASEALTEQEVGAFADEEILVQGTVDCCFMEDGKWILLDYKTDRGDDLEEIRERHRPQLRVYALALERITGIEVAESAVCLLARNVILKM